MRREPDSVFNSVRPHLVGFLVFVVGSTAWADSIKTLNGTTSRGKISDISPTELTIELGQTKKKFTVNDVDLVTFDREPADLTQARVALRAGRLEEAKAGLDKINLGKVDRTEIAQDIEFYKALVAARMALAGNLPLPEAAKGLVAVERTHKTNFHYLEICEALGDLASAMGRFDEAEKRYAKLAAAPWPEYKLRAGVLSGRALAGQKEFARAIAQFDEVIAMDGSGKEIDKQKLAATLGRAAALAGSGKTAEATGDLLEIISQGDPENYEMQARAHNALGAAYKSAGKKKEALLAYLTVDLIYSRQAEQHAEALSNLAVLFKELKQDDRAAQALSQLKEKYPDSAWATK